MSYLEKVPHVTRAEFDEYERICLKMSLSDVCKMLDDCEKDGTLVRKVDMRRLDSIVKTHKELCSWAGAKTAGRWLRGELESRGYILSQSE